MEFSSVQDYILDREYEKAMDELSAIEKNTSNYREYQFYENTILNKQKDYDTVLTNTEFDKDNINDITDIKLLISIFSAHYGKMQYDKAGEILEILLNYKDSDSINLDNQTIYEINYSASFYYHKLGEYKKAISLTKENEDLLLVSDFKGSDEKIGHVYFQLGLINDYLGNLKEATQYYEKCIRPFKDHPDSILITKTYYNLGGIYLGRGLLEKAFSYLEKARKSYYDLGDMVYFAYSKIQTAKFHFAKGELDKTLRELGESHELMKEHGSWPDLFFVITDYMEIYFDLKDIDMFKHYLTQLEELLKGKKLPIFYASFLKYYRALRNSLSSSTRIRAKGMDELEELYKGRLIDFDLTYKANIRYNELLLQDYLQSQDDELYFEIKENLLQLEKFAYDQEISSLLVISYMFKSKLKMIEGDRSESKNILRKAKSIAKDHGYDYLDVAISAELDHLIYALDTTTSDYLDLSLKERILQSKLKHLISLQSSSKPRIATVEDNAPILLEIFSTHGELLHQYNFVEENSKEFDQMTITVKSLIKAATVRENFIDKLENKNYTVIFNYLGDLIISLIFTGPSYKAELQLEELCKNLVQLEIFANQITSSNDLQDTLNKRIQEIFF